MTNHLVFLAGWGINSQALAPFVEALTVALPHFTVQLEALPQPGATASLTLETLDRQLPKNCWLAGWSLGGMLATALAEKRQTACAGVITYASNACFVANEHWPQAMPANTFNDFYQLCQHDLAVGLKRFSLLCSQGAKEPRLLAKHLHSQALTHNTATRLAGLNLLQHLDNRLAITNFKGPQLHLLAKADTLVPYQAATAIKSLNPYAKVEVLGASHASPIAQPHLSACKQFPPL